MRRAPVLLAALVALASAGCGGGGDDGGQTVRTAAARTIGADSSRMDLTIDVRRGDQRGSVTARGVYEYGTRRGRVSTDLSSVPGLAGAGTVETIVDGPVLYLRFPRELLGQLPDAKSWVKLDLAAAARAGGVDLGDLGQLRQSDPTQALHYLRGASDDVKEVGHDTLRGVDTTHYRATLDLRKAGAGLSGRARTAFDDGVAALGTSTLPADVWIDGDGRVRKMTFAHGPTALRMELYDFGVDVVADPPPAGDVFDLATMFAGAR